ncbi:Mog1p/PsbP-like protein [Gigaspora margarita]|uniref:Mog1p/PsbP-like protein n=2 Tax=Gigaspora margarita TaxID=4874 RepID=A0A8H4EL57_GIGMA|nr:Mog1p/PsbP-like protein [Gigaspora margarita]
MTTLRDLFGGAIVAHIPPTFIDVSDIREIADNQEVFADINSDESIVIEILQYVNEPSNEDAVRYHFASLAHDNDAEDFNTIQQITELTALEVPKLPPDTPKYLLVGQQQISKFDERDPSARNLVTILMALFRFPNIQTDIVITCNIPVILGATSSSRLVTQEGDVNEGYEEFRKILTSFDIKDWGLFNA